MRLRHLQVILFIFLFSRALSQEGVTIAWNYGNLTFTEFAAKAENNNNLRFFYRDEWVRDLKLGEFQGTILFRDLLENLFRGTSLYFLIDESGNVIITKDFEVKISAAAHMKDKNFIPPTEYYDEQGKDDASGNIVVDIGNPAEKNIPGKATITGYILNRDTKEPLAGVTVYVQKLSTGSISNQYGFYSLALPKGSHMLQYAFMGMKEKRVNINLYGSGDLNMDMNSVLIPLGETIITAQKNMTLQRFEVGLEKINITSFKLMPTTLGEVDIIKSVLMIPGVQSVGEGSAGFNVRGGSADQNLILLYGAPVYNSSHFFGFFSAVNSDIIKDVTLYKGGIPAKYGGRISSVLDITAKDGSRRKLAGTAGISPVTTYLTVEGPIKRDTASYMFSGRTTYSDYLLKLIDNPSLQNSSAFFYDFTGRITYDINKNNKLDVSGYISHDAFRFNSDTTYSYNNLILAARWRHFFSSTFFSVLTLNNSGYRYDISSETPPTEGFVLSHRINTTGIKGDFNWYRGRHEVNFGLDANIHSILPGKFLPSGSGSLVVPDYIEKERALESAIYLDDKFLLSDLFSINGGIRFSTFFAFGPKNVMIYDPAFARSVSTITDTIHYGSGEVYKAYAGPEFRLSFNFKLSTTTSLKLNYNRTRQYLHLLSNSTSISPSDTWKLSDYYIRPQSGNQFALGFYHVLEKRGIETSAEIYYKTIKNMVDFKGGTNLIMNENIEKDLVNVNGKAYGIEFMIRKTEGKLRWSLGYTYARTFIRSTGKFSDEIINAGNWFPANFDKPHDLITTMSFLLSRRFSISANYTYSTGRPITYPISTYYLHDLLLIHYSDRNKYRLPDYSRLDISWKISGSLKSRKIAHPSWTFSVYNLLSRQNIYSVYFREEKDIIYGYRLSVFGQAIPSVTFSFDF